MKIKYCRKCKNFYDDELLKFCLNDGSPLAQIDQTYEIWKEGINKILQTKKLIRRETRKNQIKKIISILITSILIIMVISVVTLWSWVYVNKPEVEIQKEISIPIAEPSPSSTTEILLVDLETPTPTPPPTPETSPSITPLKSLTPQISPTNISNMPICNDKEKLKIKNYLEKNYFGIFFQSVVNVEKDKPIVYFKQKYPFLLQREFTAYPSLGVSINIVDCSNPKVQVNYSFLPSIKLDINIEPYKNSLTLDCKKKNNNWACS